MQNLFYNISQVLGITILHSLWQGLIIFIGLRLFLLAIPAVSSATKYRVAYATLCAMLGWFIVTLFNQLGQYNWLSTTALQLNPLTLPAVINDISTSNKLYFTIAQYMPYLTAVYVAGVVFNALKLSLSWNSIYRIRQNTSDAGFDNTIKRLSAKLNITRFVHVAFSEWVDVPCVTGYIKPVILLPLAVTCYLSTAEVEAILLHELAHVKRNDYLLNFIQQVISILLFFNPFTRLVNNIINQERENCCDDEVVHVTGSPFIYAQALLKLEENKQTQQQQLALAAATTKYELLNRIERIMKTKTQTVNIRPVLITVLALTCAISSIAWLNPEIKNGKIVIKNAPAIKKLTAAIADPAPAVPEPAAPTPQHQKNIRFKFVADTTKSVLLTANDTTKKKIKIIVEDDNGNKKEYNSVNEMPDDVKNSFYQQNGGDEARIAKQLKEYSNFISPELQKQIAEIQEQAMAHVNDPQFKKQLAEIQQQAMDMAEKSYFNNPQSKKELAALQKQALAMAAKANSPQFKKQIAEIQKNAEKIGKDYAKYYDSPAGKKQLEELQKNAEKIGNDYAKYYDTPEGKKQLEDMQKKAEEIGKYYESPEFQKKMDDMGKNFDNPKFQKQIEDMVKQAVDKSELDNITKDKVNKEIDKQIQKAEKKEKVEKKEKKEKKEQPEKPEKQEQPEKQESANITNSQKPNWPLLAMVAPGKSYTNYGFSNSNSDTVIKKRVPTAIKKSDPQVKEIAIDEPLPAKKPAAKKSNAQLEEIRIEEPTPAKKPAAKKTAAKLSDVVIEEPLPAKKP